MTRSIFDPTGPNTERSGNTFLGADADNRSHMPESAVDGVVSETGVPEEAIVEFDSTGNPVDPTAVKTAPDDTIKGANPGE